MEFKRQVEFIPLRPDLSPVVVLTVIYTGSSMLLLPMAWEISKTNTIKNLLEGMKY